MTQAVDTRIYSLMQTDEPFKSYKKTILARLQVFLINPFTRNIESMIVEGNPHGDTAEDCIIDVWDEMEDAYFTKANRVHFQDGSLIPYKRKAKKKEKSVNEVTDEELEKILHMKYFGFKKRIHDFTAVAPVFRALEMAKEADISDKYVTEIENKLSELQLKEYPVTEEEE